VEQEQESSTSTVVMTDAFNEVEPIIGKFLYLYDFTLYCLHYDLIFQCSLSSLAILLILIMHINFDL
jgi:hypothetical protein